MAALIRQNRGHLEQDRVLQSVLAVKCFSEGGRRRNVSVWRTSGDGSQTLCAVLAQHQQH